MLQAHQCRRAHAYLLQLQLADYEGSHTLVDTGRAGRLRIDTITYALRFLQRLADSYQIEGVQARVDRVVSSWAKFAVSPHALPG